ncbi:MAG: T9SS type A sorting domain-containing protein, partial [Bacteroidales bacterium]|nr:T9SS type A sorting domain-containing protein [Bacteroidales bacterium]
NDGHYSYNACRDPWRLATDYLVFGEEKANAITIKINQWLMTDCENNVSNVKSGYKLDGTVTGNWQDLSFIAPFTVGAMTDTENQQWLNDLYTKTLSMSFNGGGYYGNSLKLLSMLTISGNYWVPSCEMMNGIGDVNNTSKTIFKNYPNIAKDNIHIEFEAPNSSNDFSVVIRNSSGIRVLYADTKTSNINISSLSNGLYFVSAINKQNAIIIQTEKFIISR